MVDQLVEVPRSDWQTLRDLYNVDREVNFHGYAVVEVMRRWIDLQTSNEHLQILSLNGDWTDGTFVAFVS